MIKYYLLVIKSLFLGFIVWYSFGCVLSFGTTNTGSGLINGILIPSVMFFCTYLIIDEIRDLKNK